MDSVALTDHGNLYGAVEFYKKAKKKGIKPIIGCEVYQAVNKMEQKRPNIDNKRYHLLLLVKNKKGYENLVKLITAANLKGFYYKPRIDEEILAKHSEGLIGATACIQGKIPRLIIANKIEEAKKQALKYKEIFDPGSFYLEIQHHPNIKGQQKVNEQLIKFSKELDIPLIATCDSHYLNPEDAKAQDILMLINTGADPNDPERITMQTDDFSVKSQEDMIKFFKDVPEAIENTQKIVNQCNFEFTLGETKLPYFEVPKGETPKSYLRKLCEKGIKKRYDKEPGEEVRERMNYELSVIEEMGFSSYFLIVQDFVNWAKENRIVVGPGRGSAAGSLISYLLGITNVDPLKYNLLFERFLNRERISMPDIDLDFTDRRRDEVINYVAQRYGRDRVAQIITFGTMSARAVIRDVGRAMNLAYSYCDKIAKTIPFGYTLDKTLDEIQEFRQLYETDEQARELIDFSKKLEGCARHASTHACGIVISKNPLQETVPLQHPTQDDNAIVTQYEMHSIEDLGLLKMDLLGLKNLTIIEDALARVYKVQDESIDIENLPPEDKKAFSLLRQGETTGVFQLESEGMKRYLKQLKPTHFEDIIAMVALYRPGPMAIIPEYIQRKHGDKEVRYLHPKLKNILSSTYGLPVYQEQIMQIAQQLAGFSLSEADILRKAVGKKIKKLLIAQKEKLIEGMKDNSIKEDVAKKIWGWIEPAARYSFNKSHATAYAMIAYQTAYLKAHYPVEFMSALLTSEKNDIERIADLISECKKMGIEVLSPDINESFRNFSVVPEKGKIRFGLLAIKNVGSNVVETIITERKKSGPFKSISDFVSRVGNGVLNKKSMESMIKAGVFDSFEERQKLLYNLERLLNTNREIQKNKENNQGSLFGDSFHSNPNIKLEDVDPVPEKEKLSWEKELLGLYISSHPLKRFKKKLEDKVCPINEVGGTIWGQKIKIGGIISRMKKIITKNGNPMLFMKVEDLNDKIEVIVFPRVMERSLNVLEENKIVMITGKVDNQGNQPKIICDKIEEIRES
jgi:DNA polymerase-3 subunit alpha